LRELRLRLSKQDPRCNELPTGRTIIHLAHIYLKVLTIGLRRYNRIILV
jgi:hypothetical protein